MDKKEELNTIEEYLKNYKTYQVGLKNIQSSLMEILPSIHLDSRKSIGIDGDITVIYSAPEEIINRMAGSRVIYLIEQLRCYSKLIEWINRVLVKLSEEQTIFVKSRYFCGSSMEQTAKQLDCSVQKCFKMRLKILETILEEYQQIGNERI